MRRLRTIIATTGIALVAAIALPASANAATLTPSTTVTVVQISGYTWGGSAIDGYTWGGAHTDGYTWGG